jgi:hypothetical protein
MRFAALLLLLAACSKPPADTGAAPVYEWLCNGRTADREVTTRVMAASRDEAIALAKKQYPDMTAPACTPNPRR